MSLLKSGSLCVIIAGCPENIGVIVEVIERIGGDSDCYRIKTVSGRPFAQLWNDEGVLSRGDANICFTDRHKLRPLVDAKDKAETLDGVVTRETSRDSLVQVESHLLTQDTANEGVQL